MPEVYTEEPILKKCYGGKPSFVSFVLRDLGLPHASFASPDVVQRIEQLPDDEVNVIAERAGVSAHVPAELNVRKRSLAADYATWFDLVSKFCRIVSAAP